MPMKTYPGYGREMTLRQWSEILEIPRDWLKYNLGRRLSIEEANEMYNGQVPDLSSHRYPAGGG